MSLAEAHHTLQAARTPAASHSTRHRLLMVQTQAENAGAQEISRILAEGFSGHGHEVHQTFLFRRTGSFDEMANTTFCADERPANPLQLLNMMWQLFRLMRRLKPDAVLCFQHYGNILAAPVARLAGVPLVVANRVSAVETMPGWLQHLDRLAGSLGLFSRVVVNSANVEEEYAGYPQAYRRRLARIDHGFKPKISLLPKSAARDQFGLPRERTVIGCVARLHPLKNLKAAVRLLCVDWSWHLALAGQGPEAQALVQLADELGCRDRLHLVGELQPEGVADFLRTLDVFVFPTLAETFGLAAVEAAQAGVPVIANDLPVLREVLQTTQGPCAEFADAEDHGAFARAVTRVTDDPARARVLSDRGRSLAAKYALDTMVTEYETLVDKALTRP